MPKAVGEIQMLKGFFTSARTIRMQPAAELERRLGFRFGRLSQGYWLMFLTKLPTVEQFEYRGMTHMSGGIFQGHKPEHRNDPNAEQLLQAQGVSLGGNANQSKGAKHATLQDTFTLHGHMRLAKVRPIAAPVGDPNVPDYPPGSGFPQWELTVSLPWVAAAFVGPGKTYEGVYQ